MERPGQAGILEVADISRQTCPGRRSPANCPVSLHTVNTHVRRIYAKLGADDRSAAVHRARKLRLLSASRTH
jgi:hypothetical protein